MQIKHISQLKDQVSDDQESDLSSVFSQDSEFGEDAMFAEDDSENEQKNEESNEKEAKEESDDGIQVTFDSSEGEASSDEEELPSTELPEEIQLDTSTETQLMDKIASLPVLF